MPGQQRKLKRYEHANDARYLTCSCYQRMALFSNDAIKDRFVHQLNIAQIELEFHLYAWVLMPEHFHLLIRPSSPEQTVETILRRIKAGFAQRVIQRWQELNAPILPKITDAKDKACFWQPGGGYDRNIHSEAEFLEKITYIHRNPAKRGLANKPAEWAWSSARAYEQRTDHAGPKLSNITL